MLDAVFHLDSLDSKNYYNSQLWYRQLWPGSVHFLVQNTKLQRAVSQGVGGRMAPTNGTPNRPSGAKMASEQSPRSSQNAALICSCILVG